MLKIVSQGKDDIRVYVTNCQKCPFVLTADGVLWQFKMDLNGCAYRIQSKCYHAYLYKFILLHRKYEYMQMSLITVEWRTLHYDKLCNSCSSFRYWNWTGHVAQISRGIGEINTEFGQENLLRKWKDRRLLLNWILQTSSSVICQDCSWAFPASAVVLCIISVPETDAKDCKKGIRITI